MSASGGPFLVEIRSRIATPLDAKNF